MFCVFWFSTPASHSPLVLFGHSALPPPRGGSASRVSPRSCTALTFKGIHRPRCLTPNEMCCSVCCTATHCNTHCNTATHTATLSHHETCCSVCCTATHCNTATLQHTLQHLPTTRPGGAGVETHENKEYSKSMRNNATHHMTLYTVTRCNTLQHTALRCNTLQRDSSYAEEKVFTSITVCVII